MTGLRKVLVAVVAVALLGLGAAPAHAEWPSGTGGGAPPPTTGGVRKVVKTCRLSANANYFGYSCGKVTSGAQSIRDILQGEDLPHCWNDDLPPDLEAEYAQRAAERIANGEKGHYLLETCLEGIDPVTLLEIGEVDFIERVVWLDGPGITLTKAQLRLVAIEQKDSTYPVPTVRTSPTDRPRVGQYVAFSLATPTTVGPMTFVRAGAVMQMRAKVVHLSVVPEPGGRRLDCNVFDQLAAPGDSPLNRPDLCWWKFERSSAAQDNSEYKVHSTAYWEVEYSQNGGAWLPLGTFEREADRGMTVTEVQTLVIR